MSNGDVIRIGLSVWGRSVSIRCYLRFFRFGLSGIYCVDAHGCGGLSHSTECAIAKRGIKGRQYLSDCPIRVSKDRYLLTIDEVKSDEEWGSVCLVQGKVVRSLMSIICLLLLRIYLQTSFLFLISSVLFLFRCAFSFNEQSSIDGIF